MFGRRLGHDRNPGVEKEDPQSRNAHDGITVFGDQQKTVAAFLSDVCILNCRIVLHAYYYPLFSFSLGVLQASRNK